MVALLPRVYPIADTAILARRGFSPTQFVQALLDGGATLVQFRHKGAFTRPDLDELESVAALCQTADAQLIVNDRADFAALYDAGLHVGQEDLPPALARRVLGERMLGLSTHNEAQLRAAAGEPVDYVALGPLFPTSSKSDADPAVGLDALRRWRPLAGAKPLVAIGGITLENACAVMEAGADCVALIGALLPESDELTEVKARVTTWIKQLR
jgi:thiamine-phosphate pyrophosphorylase